MSIQKVFTFNIIILLSANFIIGQGLDSSRITGWSKAGLSDTSILFKQTLSILSFGGDPSGEKDNTLALKKALTKANGVNSIISFPEGTFRFDYIIKIPSGIIIKGAGSEKTKFIFTLADIGFKGNFEIMGENPSNKVNVVDGLNQGSIKLTLDNSTNYSIGDYIDLSQDNDAAVMFTDTRWNQGWADRSVGQLLKITAIDPATNSITIDCPLRISFKKELNPTVEKITPAKNVGFEDFYIENTVAGDKTTFLFKNVTNCWLKGIHSVKASKMHIYFDRSSNCYVKNCFITDSYQHDGGGHGYGVLCANHTTNCLIENNIFTKLRHSMIVKEGANGNVFAYNYSCCGTWDHLPSIPADISIHGHFSFMNLFESNSIEHINSADHWGPSGPGTTFFRNVVTEDQIDIRDHSINQNIYGNILLKGKINIEPTCTGTIQTGNKINGKIEWNITNNQQLVNSLYLKSKPDFFNEFVWPCIGPEISESEINFPAKKRFLTKKFIMQPTNK